jgi:hypothetical protein
VREAPGSELGQILAGPRQGPVEKFDARVTMFLI